MCVIGTRAGAPDAIPSTEASATTDEHRIEAWMARVPGGEMAVSRAERKHATGVS